MANSTKPSYKIKFDTTNAFSAQSAAVSRERKSYTGVVAKNNNAVEVLDRYDDFDSLKIPPDAYRRPNNGSYGIQFNENFHINYVVLEHQLAAAQAFLGGLRGFGLLADVVGSGKTYEAGIVLSELAARSKVKSLLIVAPKQVLNKWKKVIEIEFGLGKGALVCLGDRLNQKLLEGDNVQLSSGNFVIRPARPAIVSMEDFACWPNAATKYLFDVIIVDEAHHLCSEEGQYAAAMILLSSLMKVKRMADKPYCLLLSATPHSGNLAKMFRLWYFVKCKGGEPSDFKDGAKTEQYLKEYKHYTEGVCKGAKTVMEFIKRVKVSEVLQPLKPRSGETFIAFLKTEGFTFEAYNKLPYEERALLADKYLDNNQDIKNIVYERVANAYHNMLLRNIMIRQPRSAGERCRIKSKSAENIFFFKLKTELNRTVRVLDRAKNIKVDVDIENFDGDKAVKVGEYNGSVQKYIEQTRGVESYGQRYGEFIISVFNEVIGGEKGQEAFVKRNSVAYYWEQFNKAEKLPGSGVSATHNRIKYVSPASNIFDAKVDETVKIIKRHGKENIVIFFDYKIDEKKRVDKEIYKRLKEIPEISGRLILSDEIGAIERFQSTDKAVLIVTDAGNTESVDLQKGNIVINFQVTPDPVAMDQRIGRVSRLGQENDIKVYSLADMTELEGYILAYYARIGLMTSNDGDATIIAGSNSEEMVTVMCKACHNVKLYYYEDYLIKKKNNELYCDRTEQCKQNDKKGTLMEEIVASDFKCNNSSGCEAVLARPFNDSFVYRCISINNTQKGLLCSTGRDNDRQIFCSKLCAMSHCQGKLKKLKCPVVAAYNENNNVGPAKLEEICLGCPHNQSGECPDKCKFIGRDSSKVIAWNDPESIKGCSTCDGATCNPKPYVIDFRRDKDEWEAKCPVCHTGTLKKVTPHSFAAYIQKLWDFQGESENFCDSLNIEAKKVAEIQIILQSDKAGIK